MKLIIKSTKKSIATISAVLVLFVASIFTYNTYMIKNYNRVSNISVEQVKKIAKLSTLKISLSATSQATSDTTFIKRFVTAQIVANIYLSTDISNINIIKDKSNKSATIYMSTPKVTSVDVTKFTVTSSKEKTFGILPRIGYINTDSNDTATTKAMFNGKQKLSETASSQLYIDQAKDKTLDTMQNLFKSIGWKITIKWV